MRRLPAPDRWRLLAPILEEALELPRSRRGAFLDQACGGDAGLRAEIEDLLSADSEAGSFLGTPVELSAVALPPGEGPDSAADAASLAGTTIGPYRVVREIGRGGMGVVYEAEQQRPQRPVALKVILGGRHVDATAVRMFQREADSLARLKHSGIAAIYESGSTDEGQHFFAMELVQGRSLSRYLDESGPAVTRPDQRRRLALFRKISAAVAYAHQRGVIHRDLKPSNILVLPQAGITATEDGDAGPSPGRDAADDALDIKILDFGLARITGPDAEAATAVTAIGRIQGTLPYMSPEQMRGRRDEIDVRADVYALGVILYRMLSGRLPYDLENAGFPEAARIVCEQAPRPLRASAGGRARFDQDLTVIVHKALEKEPDRRYQTVAAFDEDVARYLGGQPILARPASAAYQIRKLVARHTIPFAAAGVLLASLLGFAIVATLQARRIAVERDRANREVRTALQVSDFLTGLFKVSDPRLARGSAITAREILDKGVKKIEEELADEPEVRARLMLTMGNVYSSLGLYQEATPILEQSVDMRRRLLGGDHPDTLLAMAGLAFVYGHQGRYEEGEKLDRRVLEVRRRVLGVEHPDTLQSMVDLANVHRLQRRYADAQRLYSPAVEGLRRVLGDDHPTTIAAIGSLVSVYAHQDQLGEAEKLLRETLDRLRRVVGENHPYTLNAMHQLAGVFDWEDRLPEAKALYRETLDRRRLVLGEGHYDTLVSMIHLAGTYSARGSDADAESLLRETLAKSRRALGEDHPFTARILYSLGCAAARRGERSAAVDWFGQAVTHGYSNAEALAAQNEDLKYLRGDPAFETIVARARKNSGE